MYVYTTIALLYYFLDLWYWLFFVTMMHGFKASSTKNVTELLGLNGNIKMAQCLNPKDPCVWTILHWNQHCLTFLLLIYIKVLWLVKLLMFYGNGFEFLKLVVSTSSVVWSQVRWFFILEYFHTFNHGERIKSFRLSSMFYCLNYYPVGYNAIYIHQSCTIV